jgi:hypothetical protein
MATTTPNYLWSVPTSSDLVKNGATAIETLGDSVDDALWSSGYGQAGKNKVINADFSVNQRAFTSTTATSTYIFDRYRTSATDGTSTFTAQTFTAGAAPVAGYESTNFLSIASTGQTLTTARTSVEQRIEDVRTLAGQTATISFWAKAASGTPSICPELAQIFGSGGSGSVTAIGATKIPITTSWARYTVSGVSIPSVSGKTIGTGSELRLTFWTSAGSAEATRSASLGIQTATISLWGVQLEYGSKATPFQTASGGSPQAELAMCQRYYFRNTPNSVYGIYGLANGESTTQAILPLQPPVPMRVTPTSVEYANLLINLPGAGGITITSVAVNGSYAGANVTSLTFSASAGLVVNTMYRIINNNNTAGYLAVNAEL